MRAEITALDDVTREVVLTFSEGSKVFAQLHVDERIDGVGDLNFQRSFTDIFYIKVGLASDAIHNDGDEQPDAPQEVAHRDRDERNGERGRWATVEEAPKTADPGGM